jgi:hypothetical protein
MMLSIALIAAGATLLVVAWFVLTRHHPEDASGHGETDRTGSALMHGDVDDRPAGPGAEGMFVAEDGEISPGPTARSPLRRNEH